MEQYELNPETIYGDMLHCLKNYEAINLFVRLRGSVGGDIKIDENLERKTLAVDEVLEGLSFLVDGKKIYVHEEDDFWKRRFSLAYDTEDKPISVFRSANGNYLLEITFKGKIPLKFHSWMDEEAGWKYWVVDR